MSSRLAASSLIALTLLLGAACSGRPWGASPAEVPMAITPADHQFRPVRGETFSVVLKSAAAGGYQWHLVPGHDARVARLLNQRTGELPAAHPPLAGRFADEIFDFEAAGSGETTLEFRQYRAWEGPAPTNTTARFRVVVL